MSNEAEEEDLLEAEREFWEEGEEKGMWEEGEEWEEEEEEYTVETFDGSFSIAI